MPAKRVTGLPRRGWVWLALLGPAGLSAGCESAWAPFGSKSLDVPADTLILRSGVFEVSPPNEKDSAALAAAQELYRQEKYPAAERSFHHLAEKCKHPRVAEEARFYEAECLYKQLQWPKAVDTYHRMLMDFPTGVHRGEAAQRMYAVAEFWLKDTYAEAAQRDEVKAGKRWMVTPTVFHFDKSKPLLDEEGRALQALENVHLADIRGPLGEKALFLAGRIKLYREDYREADHYFSLQLEQYPNGPLAADAIEGAIFAKHMSTGGPDYDNRKSVEAYNLIKVAQVNHPTLLQEKGAMLDRQMVGIHLQAAQRDLNSAEFYRRTGHPGSAYYCYEIVRRRYPGTPQAEQATERMVTMRTEMEKQQKEGKPAPFWMRLIGKPAAVPPAEGKPPAGEKPAGDEKPQTLPAPRQLPTSLPAGELSPR